ncbi:hypothetical protein [Saccharothrix syringae]|nr:hypothetical protein [Saccharothrix syringae]
MPQEIIGGWGARDTAPERPFGPEAAVTGRSAVTGNAPPPE